MFMKNFWLKKQKNYKLKLYKILKLFIFFFFGHDRKFFYF